MILNSLPGIAAGMSLLMSPDHLRLWGNLAGQIGPLFAVAAAAIYASLIASYRRLAYAEAARGEYLKALQAQGGLIAIALALTSRLALTIGLSTGILVTSGFVFNETFVYWFPNFAFAFLYLGLIAVIQCWGYARVEKLQAFLMVVAALGLATLVLTGFWQLNSKPVPDALAPSGFNPGPWFGALLLFVGFDFGIHRSVEAGRMDSGISTMGVVLGLSIILLGLWGAVSLDHVSANRLADTFIPYTLAARNIAGPTGRAIIGIVVLTGTGCAVISLFSASTRMLTALARLKMLPRFCQGSTRRGLMVTCVIAAAVAAMMAAGVAGEPELEVFIRAAFFLWLLHAVAVHMAAFKCKIPIDTASSDRQTRLASWLPFTAAIIVGAGAFIIWVGDAERMLILKFILAIWSGGALLLLVVRLVSLKQTPPVES